MPAATAKGYPYPLGTDRVMDGDDAIKNLATAVDTNVGVAFAGQVSIPITAVNTPVSVSVTLPAGRFPGPAPNMGGNVTAFGGTPDNFRVSIGTLNVTTLLIWGSRTSGTAAFNVGYCVNQTV